MQFTVSVCRASTNPSMKRFSKSVHYPHCTVSFKQIFPEMKLRGLAPNFFIHVYIKIAQRYINAEIRKEASKFHF
jgi:hypothetical protein